MCKIQEFDDFFVKEYDYLLGFSKSINPKADYESLLHDCYCKCKDRITLVGYTGNTFLNWIRVVIMNQYKSSYRLEQKRHNIDFNDENYSHHIEQNLQEIYDYETFEKERQASVEYLNTMVYSYIDEHYDEKSKFIFKTYFLLKPKKINYKRLAELTGYSIASVSNTIKNMKKDIKNNLEDYIYGQSINTGHTIGVS